MGSLRRIRDGTRVLLSSEHVFGRLPSCRTALSAAFVSSVHALIRWSGEAWEIRDLGSRNGTFVDGERVEVGATVRLHVGATLMFGQRAETWDFVDDRAPAPAAVPLDDVGGDPSFFSSGVVAIPGAAEPLATIYSEGDAWMLEVDDTRSPLLPGDTFSVGGKSWRFECPSGAVAVNTAGGATTKLSDVTLAFEVSTDEEFVSLKVRTGRTAHDLGNRTCFYLGLVLSRQRIKDAHAGMSEPGWVELNSVLKMVPDYTSHSHLNVDIFRLRRLLYDVGIEDGARVVERRRGQIRFGTERVEIVRGEPASGAQA